MSLRFFFSSRRRHTRFDCDWSSDVCSSDLAVLPDEALAQAEGVGATVGADCPLLGEVGEGGAVVVEARQAGEDEGGERLVGLVLRGEEGGGGRGRAGGAFEVDAAEGGVSAARVLGGGVPQAGEGAAAGPGGG